MTGFRPKTISLGSGQETGLSQEWLRALPFRSTARGLGESCSA